MACACNEERKRTFESVIEGRSDRWQSSPFVNHTQTTKPSDTSKRLKEIGITAGLVGSMWLGDQ